jgi:hypothetical protein
MTLQHLRTQWVGAALVAVGGFFGGAEQAAAGQAAIVGNVLQIWMENATRVEVFVADARILVVRLNDEAFQRQFERRLFERIHIIGSNRADQIILHDVGLPATTGFPVVVEGGDGNDIVLGGPANEGIIGGKGDDTLLGGRGDDVIFGGEGNDTLEGELGRDVLGGEAGNDRFVISLSGLREGEPVRLDNEYDSVDGGIGVDDVVVIGRSQDDFFNLFTPADPIPNPKVISSVGTVSLYLVESVQVMGGDGRDSFYVDSSFADAGIAVGFGGEGGSDYAELDGARNVFFDGGFNDESTNALDYIPAPGITVRISGEQARFSGHIKRSDGEILASFGSVHEVNIQ